jgi:hypothetical protein
VLHFLGLLLTAHIGHCFVCFVTATPASVPTAQATRQPGRYKRATAITLAVVVALGSTMSEVVADRPADRRSVRALGRVFRGEAPPARDWRRMFTASAHRYIMRLRQSFLRIASRAILTCRADELRMVAICKDIRSWRVDLRAFLSLALAVF